MIKNASFGQDSGPRYKQSVLGVFLAFEIHSWMDDLSSHYSITHHCVITYHDLLSDEYCRDIQ